MITLTEKAANKLKDLFKAQSMPEGTFLRVGVKGGGCSGFSYHLDIASAPGADDEVFESHGLKVVCDLKSYLYMDGCELDYEESMLNSKFVFNNPNAKKTCGCGASFST